MHSLENIAINSELIHSAEQVYALRHIMSKWFGGTDIQTLKISADHIEKARSVVALVDVLKRAKMVRHVLIMVHLSKHMEMMRRSFELHTNYRFNLEPSLAKRYEIHFFRYREFLENFGYDDLNLIFDRYDLIIVDEPDDEKCQLFMQKLAPYKGWLLKLHGPKQENLSFI